MNTTKPNPLKRILNTRGMGGALTAFAGLIVIYIAFGIINPTVFSGQNIMNLLRSMSKYLLIGIGQSYILITGNIDLSIGSVAGMSAMISATLMTKGIHPIAAILVTLVCCLAIGVLNGLLVGKWKLPPFIATLGTMFVARGVAYIVNRNRNTDAIASGIGKEAADSFGNFFYYGSTFGIYNTFWIAIALFVVFFFLLSTTTKAYLVSAFCSFVVGLILCGQAGMGNMEAGNMYEMYGVAAGVIGGVSPLGGTGILLGTLAGAAVWQTLENGLNMIGAQVGIQRLVIGIIVVVAVFLDVVVRNGARKKPAKAG
ncbi:MAG: ABC transporter permease [Lawsonibacter sp.]|jgi:ribose transport system permease protein|nr:ABC transporter permease [Lawsonibacter sp.]